MRDLKKLEKKVRDSLKDKLSKSELEYYTKKAEDDLLKWVVAIVKPLGQRKITFKEAIKSIKQELEIRFETPSTDSIFTVEDELIKKEVIYLKVLKIMREYFKQMIFDADEKERKITLDKTYPDYFEEIFNKINIELYNHLERAKWIGIFYGEKEYEAFTYIVNELPRDNKKVLFKILWNMYNKILISCVGSEFDKWVYKEYFPSEKVSPIAGKFDCNTGNKLFQKVLRISKQYPDQKIFKYS